MTLPITITTERNYYFSRADVSFKLNDLGDASCTQVVSSSSAALRLNLDLQTIYHDLFNTVVTEGEVSDATPDFFDIDGNYRTWKVKGYPTYFNSPDKRYCHIVVRYDQYVDTKNPKRYEEATVVFAARRLDLYGRAITDDGKQFLNANGNAVTNLHPNYIGFDMFPVDENYCYIYIGRISAVEDQKREWEEGPSYGILGTPAYMQSDVTATEPEQPHLVVTPDFAQFSWKGTDYTEKSVTIKADVVMPGGVSSTPSLNNVIDEVSLSVLPLLTPDQTGHISSDVRSVITTTDSTLPFDTAVRFDLCSFVSRNTITEFASITTTLNDQPLLTIDARPQEGAFYVRLKAGYNLRNGIESDVNATTTDGYSFTRHFAVRAIQSAATDPQLTAQSMILRPAASFVLRRNADGTLSPSPLFADFIETLPDGSTQSTTAGYLWLSVDDGEWSKVEDPSSIEGIPTDATSVRLRWTIIDRSEAFVYDYSSDTPSIADFFVVGCFERMPRDNEPDVFSQIDVDNPDEDDDVQALDLSVSDPLPSPAPNTPDVSDGPNFHPDEQPSDKPLDKDDDEPEPTFIIGNSFTVTPDHQRLYIALYERSTRKVVDSVVVPVIKDGKGSSGDPSLYVHLSKTLIAVKKTSSIWAEEGIDPEDSLAHNSQMEIIEAKVMLGPKTTDKIIDIKVQEVVGITDVQIQYAEDRMSAVISFIINSDFDISRNTDMKLTFFSEHSATDGYETFISFVPTADGEDGAQGEKGEDAIDVQMFTRTGNFHIDKGMTNTLYAEVWKGRENITSQIPAYCFSWKRVSKDPDSDEYWNYKHEAVGPEIEIGDSDVERRAMFQVNVSLDNI